MKFCKAEIEIINLNVQDIVTTSPGGGAQACSVVGMLVDECAFGG